MSRKWVPMTTARGLASTVLASSVVALLLLVAAPVFAAIPHYEVRIDGLACPFCAYGLEKKLKALPGARNVHIDLDRGLATFDVDEAHVVLPGPVREAVRKAGFTPRRITIRATGTVSGGSDRLVLDVGGGHRLTLRGGSAFDRLREFARRGARRVSVTGQVHSARDGWVLEVDQVRALGDGR